jgi:hypothetical protein
MSKLLSHVSSSDLTTLRVSLANNNPIALALGYADMDPSPGQARFIKAICSQDPKYKQLVAKVHRKAGKTKCVAVAFASLFKQNPKLRIFHLSGSYWQASRLYAYFKPIVTNSELFGGSLEGEPTKYLTQFKAGGSLEVLTASAKSIRGGDADILSIDEAVLVPQKLIDAAWPLPRASQFPKRIVMSTASPEASLEWFVNLWQNAPALKFERFEWPESECHWLNVEDNAYAKLMLDSQTYAREYEGAITERTGRVWGTYRLADGRVIDLIDNALVDPRKAEEYPPPAADPLTEKWTALDWGFVGQAVLTFWEKQGDKLFIRDCRIWTETSYTEIKQEIKEDFGRYPIYPDSEAVADNADLQRMDLTVIPVIFSRDKEFLISRARWCLENGLMKIPNPEVDSRYFTLVQQMKAYHYDEKSGKPAKVNDHCCDSVICAMKHLEASTGGIVPVRRR